MYPNLTHTPPTTIPITRFTEPLLWLLFALVWFGSLGQRALIHSDEGRYATLSLMMLYSGDWITPRLNGLLYFEKPILQYWAGALSFLLFGINEFAARFWPGLTGFLTVIMVSFTARRLWGVDAGRYAALTTGGCTWLAANSHFLTLDMGVTFFLTVVLCSFILAHQDNASARQTRGWMWLTWAAMAGATLSKGLIGLLFPGTTLMLYSLIHWQWSFWKRMHWISGLLIFFGLAAPWFVLVSLRNPSFVHFFFVHEHFIRFLTSTHQRMGPIWYFIPYLVIGFMPWISLLPHLCWKGWHTKPPPTTTLHIGRLLLIWSGFILAFFSLSSSKLPSYILPLFPALTLLLGQQLQTLPPKSLRKHLLLPSLIWIIILLFIHYIRHLVPEHTPAIAVDHLKYATISAGLLFILSALLAWRNLSYGRALYGVACWAMGGLFAVMSLFIGHNSYGMQKSSKQIIQHIQPHLTPGIPFYSVRYYDQTLPFYLRRTVTLVQYVDEFAFGEEQEPTRWISHLSAFEQQWHHVGQALAIMPPDTFYALSQQGLPMQVIYQDAQRLVVKKP